MPLIKSSPIFTYSVVALVEFLTCSFTLNWEPEVPIIWNDCKMRGNPRLQKVQGGYQPGIYIFPGKKVPDHQASWTKALMSFSSLSLPLRLASSSLAERSSCE